METKVLTKKEVASLLGKSYGTVRKWSEERIKEELIKSCWRIDSIHKTGNKVTFTLTYEEQDFNINDYVKEQFKVKERDKFIAHTKVRIRNIKADKPMTKKEISKETGNSEKTTCRYDSKLINKQVISKDGYYYIKRENNVNTLVTREEYEGFWRENFALKVSFRQLGKDVESGEITAEEYAYIYEQIKQRSNIFYYKIRKYIINKGHEFYSLLKLHQTYK